MAFWERPDWTGGSNMRDGAEPFWMRPEKKETGLCEHGTWKSQCPHHNLKGIFDAAFNLDDLLNTKPGGIVRYDARMLQNRPIW